MEKMNFNPTEKYETDIVVVGAGASGLCAAVQASSGKYDVIVLETNNFI